MDATTKVPPMGPSAQHIFSFALNAVLALTSMIIPLIPHGDVKDPVLELQIAALHRALTGTG